MNRKFTIITLTLLLSCLILGFYFLVSKPFSPQPHNTDYCAFCDPAVLDRQKFYEDDLVLALYTHKPILPGHSLIIPKRHVERFEMLTDAEITQIGRVIKKVNQAVTKVFGTTAYILIQKNGMEVGQTVPHVHFHYIPRQSGEDSTIGFLFHMYLANIKEPISQEKMRENVEALKQALHESN